MLRRISLIAMTIFSLAAMPAFAGRWDVAFDGGFMRLVLDLNAADSTVAAKVYDAVPGGTWAIAENLILVQTDLYWVVQGEITSGDFKVGMGSLHFTVGDRFYLFVSRFTHELRLILVNSKGQYWTRQLQPF